MDNDVRIEAVFVELAAPGEIIIGDASDEFLSQVVRTVRLIRSKGVGVFFVTQTPKDVPEDVLAQLGSRVQHALRAYTPKDQERLRQSVKTFPDSPYDLEEVLTTLGTGEAVVTVLSEKGAPSPVAATRLRAPRANMGTAAASRVGSASSTGSGSSATASSSLRCADATSS